jgi:hypothetical protein
MANMDWDDYLRHEAVIYRQLAEKTENIFGKQELFDLAAYARRPPTALRIV